MKNSYFLGLLFQDSKLQASFENSLIYSIFSNIIYCVLRFFKSVFRRLDGYMSFFYKHILVHLFKNYNRLVMLFLVVMIITPHTYWQNMYGLLGISALFALYVLMVMLENNKKFVPIPLPVILFSIAVLMGVLISSDRSGALRVGLFYFTAILISITIMNSVRDEKQLRELLWALWFALMCTALYAVYQSIQGVAVDLSLTDTELNGGMPGRVFSTFENPNNYAELIVMLLPFTAALALSTKNIWLKLGLFASMLLPFAAIALTLSRSGWLALAAAVVIFLLLYKPLLIAPLIGIGLLAIPFLPESILRRAMTIGSMSDSSNKYRIYIWEGASKIIKNYGITGIGLGPENFGLIYPSYANETAINARHSHMLYMQLIIEMGVMGFVSVMWTVLGTMKNTWAAICKKWAKPLYKYTGFGFISAVCGIGVMAFVEYVWYYPRVLFVFFICIGIGFSLINLVRNEEKTDD